MILAVALSNAVLPAAAWYFIVKVYRFFALWGEKTIHKELKITGRRKSYICFRFSLGERKTKTDEKGLDIQAKMEYYHFDVNVKVVQAL